MKKLLFVLFISTSAIFSSYAQSSEDISNSTNWTWFGIDYTNCYYIMSYDFPSVSDLESKIGAWNNLVLTEREKFLVKPFKGKTLAYSIDMVTEINEGIDVKSRISNDASLGTHMDKSQIQEIVNNYQIPDDLSGIGLIFIAECYNKPDEQGAYYVTFFDIASKKVMSTERKLGKASGFGMRNYWANSYYVILKELGKTYK